MSFLKYKISILLLVNIFLATAVFAAESSAPITRVVVSPTVKISSMNIPNMPDDYWIWSAGSYAYAIDSDDSMISFFNGAQWSQSKKMVSEDEDFALAYPETGKKPDAWILLSNNNIYHIKGSEWSTPMPVSKILHIIPSSENIDLEAAGGYVFLAGVENNQQSNTSTLAFTVWSPKTGQWLAPTILKGFTTDLNIAYNAMVAYGSQNPSAVLLTYSSLKASKPQTYILQIEANGKYTQYTSPLLPTYNEMKDDTEFALDKKGAYAILQSSTHKLYLWYNHNSIANGWHSVQLSAEPLFPSEALLSNSVYAGTVCEEVDGGDGINLSCINTLLNHPHWSGPVTIAKDLIALEYHISTKTNGAWVQFTSRGNPLSTILPYILHYDASTETVHDTDLKLIAKESSMPVLKEPSDTKILACIPDKGSHDKLYIYDSKSWQHLPDTHVNVHGCLLSANDQLGSDLDNDQVFWISDDNDDNKVSKKTPSFKKRH